MAQTLQDFGNLYAFRWWACAAKHLAQFEIHYLMVGFCGGWPFFRNIIAVEERKCHFEGALCSSLTLTQFQK